MKSRTGFHLHFEETLKPITRIEMPKTKFHDKCWFQTLKEELESTESLQEVTAKFSEHMKKPIH